MKYTVYEKATGKIVLSGERDGGEDIVPHSDTLGVLLHGSDPSKHRVVDGQIADRNDPPHVPDYAEHRYFEYPPIKEQLDALWKLAANLPPDLLTPEVSAMLGKITSVKQRFPKSAN